MQSPTKIAHVREVFLVNLVLHPSRIQSALCAYKKYKALGPRTKDSGNELDIMKAEGAIHRSMPRKILRIKFAFQKNQVCIKLLSTVVSSVTIFYCFKRRKSKVQISQKSSSHCLFCF